MRISALTILVVLSGCGLTLDFDPPEDPPEDSVDGGRRDVGRQDAAGDAEISDTRERDSLASDTDAEAPDASRDARAEDGGSPFDGGTLDAGIDASPDGGRDVGMCEGTHPLMEDDRRFCGPGDCYCESRDKCHSAATAAACCGVDAVCTT